MRLFKYLILVCIAFSGIACREKLAQPDSLQFSTKITVRDTSFVTRAIADTSQVRGAKITLYSVNYGLEYSAVSDSNGQAVIKNIIPDFYNCSVQKNYPADTVKKYLPLQKEINLVGSVASVALRNSDDTLGVLLKPVVSSDLLISEIYYSGAKKDPPFYFHDQFTEIYNNSMQTVYLDQYAIGDAPYGYREEDPDYIHCIHLYKFPGTGFDYPLEPGQTIIVAQDGINHTEYNTNSLDLSGAEFEYYNHKSSDVDVPGVANMIQIYHKYGHDFLYSVFNDGVLLFKLEEEDSSWTYDSFNHVLVPMGRVVDGVEYRESLKEYELKHLPDHIDAGITGGIPAYQGKSVARKIFKVVDNQILLMDNNNSSIDFEVLDTPTPNRIY